MGDIEGRKPVSELKNHPYNKEVFGEPDYGLATSLERSGLQHPIKVTPDGLILSGARRWTAAKKLGWTLIDIEIPDIDFDDQDAVEDYIVLANTYRKDMPTWSAKKMADHWVRRYEEGGITKEELREIARQNPESRGYPRDKRDGDNPRVLAASAAGLTEHDYRAFTYVTDGRGEHAIDSAREEGRLSPAQAGVLKRKIRDEAERVKADRLSAQTAETKARRRLKQAEYDHRTSAEQKRQNEANGRVNAARQSLDKFASLVHQLRMDYADCLGGGHGKQIALGWTNAKDAMAQLLETMEEQNVEIEGERYELVG